MSQFLESGSMGPVKNKNDWDDILIINHVDDFALNKLYTYTKNVKLNVNKRIEIIIQSRMISLRINNIKKIKKK